MRPTDARDTVFTRVFAVVKRLNKCLFFFLINFSLHGNSISLSILYFVSSVEGTRVQYCLSLNVVTRQPIYDGVVFRISIRSSRCLRFKFYGKKA